MTSIVRNVKDIQASERRWLEDTLGQPLLEDQVVWIQVLSPGAIPSESVRQEALAELERIASKAAQHLQHAGISADEAAASVDDAVRHLRHRTS